MDQMYPSTVGRYHILGPLGQGGMGTIYRARDPRLVRDVAVKFLADRLTYHPQAIKRFIREARAASALNHPNIVTIYEIGKVRGRQFIVMELVEGQTLRALFAGPDAFERFTDLGGQMATALGAAHAAGIVHRDIKPENVMVRHDGYAKLLDFGIARLVRASNLRSEVFTSETAVLGTPRYMSPEQIRGASLTGASDMFSLGVVAYEWATRRVPFSGASPIEVVDAIRYQEPVPPCQINPQLPRVLEALILDLLQKDPTRRPSALEVADRLKRASSRVTLDVAARSQVLAHKQVGRDCERSSVRAAFEDMYQGRGLLLNISGEAGIGKTALVEDVLREFTSSGVPMLVGRGRCSERLAGTEAYSPFLEAFESLLRESALDVIPGVIKSQAPAWYSQLHVTGHNRTVPPPTKRASSQERLRRELIAVIESLSHVRPLVLFFDDIHWADNSSVDVLAFVAARLQRRRVLVLTTARPSALQLARHTFRGVLLDLQSRGLARDVPVNFLTRDDIAEYLSLSCPGTTLPAEFVSLIHERTDGNPLFMVDLVRHMRDRQVLNLSATGWEITQPVSEIARDLPISIRSLIQRKIDALEEEDGRLLLTASVQGVHFDTAIVARTLEVDPTLVEARLDHLERVHALVRFVGEKPLPDATPSSQYRFVHVLYQNGLYESLRPVRRATLSGLVARTLAAVFEHHTTDVAAELALLFEAARDVGNAARHFLIAAEKAATVFADEEAILLSRRGLAVIGGLPATAELGSVELGLRLVIGLCLTRTKGYSVPEVEQAYARAYELSEHTGDSVRLFRIRQGLCRYYCVKGELATATKIAQELLSIARDAGDPQLAAIAHLTMATPCVNRACLRTALSHAEQGLALYDPQQHERHIAITGADAGMQSLVWASIALWLLGYPDQSLARINEALDRSGKVAHPFTQAFAFTFAGVVHHYRREPVMVQQHAESALAVAAEHGVIQWTPLALMLRGWALAEQGRIPDGMSQLRQGLDAYRTNGAELNRPHFLSMLAEACERAAQLTAGIEAIDEALAVAERNDDCYWKAELHRVKGTLLLTVAPAESERFFEAAIEIARQQEAKLLELRATTSLGRLWLGQDKRAQAHARLDAACGWFAEGNSTADLRDARLLLEELSI